MMGREQALVSVVLLCGAVSILLHYFYLYHFWLIQRGLTTNEASKRSGLLQYLKKALKFLNKFVDQPESKRDP
jgi:hypothetical protein